LARSNFNTELRTGVLATLQDQLPAHRADGGNLQGLLATWDQSAKGFAATTLTTLAR
jgi:tagatose 1,6-diphosphate aldolase GatY/KbaY